MTEEGLSSRAFFATGLLTAKGPESLGFPAVSPSEPPSNQSAPAIFGPRDREVLALASQGKSAWEIGEILHIAKRTVDEHAQMAMRKLGAANRTHAVALAIRRRLFDI
ncbi:MAG TPA: helix-turn-helix transcriptional regulator [Methyloceanibacter sp.]|nr:helix-turn-helix transcriptional regulator [Methyloceanibacter sp.]